MSKCAQGLVHQLECLRSQRPHLFGDFIGAQAPGNLSGREGAKAQEPLGEVGF